MHKFRGCEESVSSVIGVILLLVLTVMMISMIALSVFAFGDFGLHPVPKAKIMIMEARGGMPPAVLNDNIIILRHKGGDKLHENSTRIIIRGRGYAYKGSQPPNPPVQDITVIYPTLKGTHFDDNDPNTQEDIVIGDIWSAGKTATLRGRDGQDPSNGCEQKYWLKEGSSVSVTVIDTLTNQIIAFSSMTVKKA